MVKKAHLKKTLVEQILDKAGLSYEGLAFNALEETSLPSEIAKSNIYKTLALVGDKTGPVIGMLPLTEHLSEKKLAKVSGNKKVQMITQKDLQATTGYIHGANNPVGIWQTKKFPIFIDRSALERTTIICSAGEIGRSIRIDPQALAYLVQARFADIRNEERDV